jgi:hypothetical protein
MLVRGLPGFIQLFSDVPYIAQCSVAIIDGVPRFLTKASFLTVTQTVSETAVQQTPATTAPAASAQPAKTPNSSPADSSPLASVFRLSGSFVPATPMRAAQSSMDANSKIRRPVTSQEGASISTPSEPALNAAPESKESQEASTPAVQHLNPQAPVPPSNGVPASSAPYQAPQPVITLAGTTIAANSVSQYIVRTQTLLQGSPAISIDGTAVSLAPPATAVIVGGSITTDLVLTPAYQVPQPPAISLLGITLTANFASQYLVGTQTLIPGGSAIIVSGAAVSLAQSAAVVVLGRSSPITLATPTTPAYSKPDNDIAATKTEISLIILGGHTLTLGGPAILKITIEGVPVHASGSCIIYGTSTVSFSEIATSLSSASVYIPQPSTVATDSQTLKPEVSAVTFGFGSGTTSILNVETGGFSVDLVPQPQGPMSTTLDGLGEVITQTTSAQAYAGSAVSVRGIGYTQWFITLATAVACCGVLI